MICNNAIAKDEGGRYSLILPEEKQAEKDAVLKEAVDKYNGYFHIEISRVRKPKTLEQNNLFHALLKIYYLSGKHSFKAWQELKNDIKYRLGQGFTQTLQMADGTKYGILKSLADYTMRELAALNNDLIKEMIIMEIDDKKFQDILKEIKYEFR